MAVLEGVVSGSLADTAAAPQIGLHTIPKPDAIGALGAYNLGVFTGILPAALTANSEVFQFRWTDATRFALIKEVSISAAASTTLFAAGVPVQVDLVKATGWSVQGTLGTGVTLAATGKTRSTMGSSLVAAGDIRIATTAALGAGTKTLEANSLATLAAGGPITASTTAPTIFPKTALLKQDTFGEYPLVLAAANEGFVIRSVAVPATGTWELTVVVKWSEVTAF